MDEIIMINNDEKKENKEKSNLEISTILVNYNQERVRLNYVYNVILIFCLTPMPSCLNNC